MDEVHGHDIDSAVADRKRTDRRYVEPVGRRLRIAAGACVGLVLLGLGLGIALDEPRPVGVPGPEAEALARRVEQATRLDAWERTGAIAFDFGGHRYLWDRRRELVEVRFDDLVVKLPLRGGRAVILRRGRPVTRQAERVEARERAVRYFVNDSFWLNPLAKLREPGVVLSAATHRGRRGLLVSYTSGGITPGDALEEFKRGFANTEQQWFTSEIVCDGTAYETLTARLAPNADSDFFPRYRSQSRPNHP